MMKKIMIIALIVLGGQMAFAQNNLKLGINGGFPVGDTSSFTDLNWGADAAYLFDFAGIIQGGPLIGYTNFIRNRNYNDLQFLPLAVSGRIELPVFLVGLDLGVAIGLGGGAGSGFFYRPKVGMGVMFFDVIASYSAVSVSEGHFSSVNLGVEVSL